MWQNKNNALYKKFVFNDFKQAFTFMEAVAKAAAQQNHHPRWLNEWNTVEIWSSSHDNGNQITDKDYRLTATIDSIVDKNTKGSVLMREAKIYTDGGSRGNPGDSSCAYVICRMDNTVVEKSGFYLGMATNNQAEYLGFKHGLERARDLGIDKVNLYSDSQLVVNQMKGLYKVKNQELASLYQEIKALANSFEKIEFNYVPRELNKIADGEVNRILDEHEQSKHAQ